MSDSEATTWRSTRENIFDVDVEKLAKIYSQAMLDAAGSNDDQGRLLEELQAIVVEVLDKHPDLEQVIRSALVHKNEKINILDRLFASQISDLALSSLKVLAQHGRLGILRQVVRSAEKLWAQRNARMIVHVEIAHEADAALQQEIEATMSKLLEGHPTVVTRVNPELIAGFVARVGDKVYDASTRTSFNRMRRAMVTHAVDVTQSRPEQFLDKNSS